MVASITAYGPPQLKELLCQEADSKGVPLSEYVVKVLAEHLGRPDLGKVPRKKMGRPRNPIPVPRA